MNPLHQSVPESAQSPIGGVGARPFRISAEGGNRPACDFTVKTNLHEPTGLQFFNKDTPGGVGVSHMMQNANAFDYIEHLVDFTEPQDVGSREVNVFYTKPLCHASTIGKAWRADIDSDHLRVCAVGNSRMNRLLAGAGTGDQDIAGRFEPICLRIAKIVAEDPPCCVAFWGL